MKKKAAIKPTIWIVVVQYTHKYCSGFQAHREQRTKKYVIRAATGETAMRAAMKLAKGFIAPFVESIDLVGTTSN